MTRNRRRKVLSAIVIATVIGWAGAGVASADEQLDTTVAEAQAFGDKWD